VTTEPKPLNRFEVWVADRAAPIFGVLVVLILAGAVAVFWTYQRSGTAQHDINVLKPQVTRINKAVCDRRSLEHDARAAACAERIRIGLINCRHSEPCRAALLAAITYPPPAEPTTKPSSSAIATAPNSEGGATQPPSNHGHQPPGPGSPGHHGGGDHHGGEDEAEPSPAPSPAPLPSPTSKPAPSSETPANGAQGGSASGVGVEVCVLERTCVGIDVDPKGLLP
jgi:hypothetical protein